MIRLDQQQVRRRHLRLREMPCRSRETLIGGDVLRNVFLIAVAGAVAGQCQKTDEGDGDRRHQDRRGPSDDRGTDPPPPARDDHALGIEDPEATACRDGRGHQRERDRDRNQDAHRAGDAQRLEVGQPGEAQTRDRTGDRDA